MPKLRTRKRRHISLRAVKLEDTLQAKQIKWAQNTDRMRRKKLSEVFQKYLKIAYRTGEETEEDLGREQTTDGISLHHVVLRQVHSLFQSKFSTQCDTMPPLSTVSILSLP